MSKIKKTIFIIFFGFLSSLYISCGGIKLTGASKNINKYIEEFYIGDGVIQYFIQPIPYIDNTKNSASLDATMRNYDKDKDSITINLTTVLKTKEKINTIVLHNNASKLTINNVKNLFREKNEELFSHRSSFKILYKEYLEYLLKENHKITTYNSTENTTITPDKKGYKKISILKEKLPNKILN